MQKLKFSWLSAVIAIVLCVSGIGMAFATINQNQTNAFADNEPLTVDQAPILDWEVETHGGVKILKSDADKTATNQTPTNASQGDVTNLKGFKYDIVLKDNLSTAEKATLKDGALTDGKQTPIERADGSYCNPGQVFTSIYTNVDGYAQTGTAADGNTATVSLPTTDETLPSGIYTIQEVETPDGYLLDDTVKRTFRIGNNYIADNSESERNNGVIVDYTYYTDKNETTLVTQNADGTFAKGMSMVDAHSNGFNNNPYRGNVKIRKYDSEVVKYGNYPDSYPQGDGFMEGIKYSIKNVSEHEVYVYDAENNTYKWVKSGEECMVITTDAGGIAQTKTSTINGKERGALPYGTYEITELKSKTVNGVDYCNDYSLWTDKSTRTFEIREDKTDPVVNDVTGASMMKADKLGSITTSTSAWINDPVRAGFNIKKRDYDTGNIISSGGASWHSSDKSLDGYTWNHIGAITFKIKNVSPNDVYVPKGDGTGTGDGGKDWYKQGEVVKTITLDETSENNGWKFENGVFITDNDLVPYGTYEIYEVVPEDSDHPNEDDASVGYNLTDKHVATVSIREHHKIYDTDNNGQEISFTDKVWRSGIHFSKKDGETAKELRFIPFLVVSNTTGEQHVIVTDVNGEYRSDNKDESGVYHTDAAKHSENTNANDKLLQEVDPTQVSRCTKVTYKDGSVKYYTIDYENLQVYNVGTWFSMDKEGNVAKPDDDEYAFPYDYSAVNDGGYTMYELPCFNNQDYSLVTTEFSIYTDNHVYDYGTLDDNTNKGGLIIEKGSDWDTGLTRQGAQFALYTNESCEEQYRYCEKDRDGNVVPFVMTVDEENVARSGETFTIPCDDITGQYYWVKEIKAPDVGFDYDADKIWKVKIRPNEWTRMDEEDVINYIWKGDILINKNDSKTDSTTPQGDGDLSGIKFEVYNNNDWYVTMNPELGDTKRYYKKTDADGNPTQPMLTLTTNEKGEARTYDKTFQYGSYLVKEVATNGSYRLTDGEPHEVFIDGSLNDQEDPVYMLVGDNAFKNDVVRGGVSIHKQDAETHATTPQGDADFAGIEFTIRNESKEAVWVNGKFYNPKEDCLVLTTDSDGNASTDTEALPYGTYSIRETKSEGGYQMTDSEERTFTIREDKKIVDMTEEPFEDIVVRGGLKIEKRDLETKLLTPQGKASLDGAEFEIINKSKNPVVVNGTTYQVGESVIMLTIKDGKAETAVDALPYGTYDLVETKSGEGYVLDSTSHTFQIRENGKYVEFTGDNSIFNRVVRGDLEFDKREFSNQHGMEGIPFVITSLTTGESHVMVTDYNGEARSQASWNLHTYNTNASDAGVTKDGNVYTVDESKLDAMAGIWYGTGEPNDDWGAFIYDDYKIEELRVERNADFDMVTIDVPDEIHIYRDGTVHDIGTINNFVTPKPEVSTKVSESEVKLTGDGVATDNINIKELRANSNYRIKGYLIDKDTNSVIKKADGSEYTETVDFTSGKATTLEGHCDMDVAMDFNVNSKDLVGRTVVIFQYLYEIDGDAETLVYQHDDINNTDQTFVIVEPVVLKTTATDGFDGDKNISISNSETIVDSVELQNLAKDKTYVLSGKLMDKATGESVKVDDKEYIVTKEIVGNGEDTQIEQMEFSIDTSKVVEGQQYVVFEELQAKLTDDGELEKIAEHADLTDEGQTVTVVKREVIKTTATDNKDADHVIASGEGVIVDTVEMKGLAKDKTYTLKGTLMDKTTGKAVIGTDVVTKDFTATGENPETQTMTFNVTAVEGATYVVFEELYVKDGTDKIAEHSDINDEGQTVTVVDTKIIHTTATESVTGNKTVDTTIVYVDDKVEMQGLSAGKEYTLKGTLMDKSTGKAVEGVDIVTKDFTATGEDPEYQTVNFKIDASYASGKTYVVFEELYEKGGKTTVAEHKDITDEDQSIDVVKTKVVKTTATDGKDNDKTVEGKSDSVIVDKVEMKGLAKDTSDKETIYVLKGTLMNKVDGKAVQVDGKDYVVEQEFKATDDEVQTQEMKFEVDLSGITEDSDFVVFEELYYKGDTTKLAEHADLDDAGQTVHITPYTEDNDNPDNNDDNNSGDDNSGDEAKYIKVSTGGNNSGGGSTGSTSTPKNAATLETAVSNMAALMAILAVVVAGVSVGYLYKKRKSSL